MRGLRVALERSSRVGVGPREKEWTLLTRMGWTGPVPSLERWFLQLPWRVRLPLTALFLSTGVGLLVHIVSGFSLWAAVGVGVTTLSVAVAVKMRGRQPADKASLLSILRVGVLSGALATAAYDLSRYLMVRLGDYGFSPFEAFELFGRALIGAVHQAWLLKVVGVGYHVTNGIAFGVAYTLLLGYRGVLAGVLWATFLEALMVSVYPGWLGLKALEEFLQVSILGHVVYGSVLGYATRRLLLKGAPGRRAA